jgi:hypothetical protein
MTLQNAIFLAFVAGFILATSSLNGQNCFTPNQVERMLVVPLRDVDIFLREQGFQSSQVKKSTVLFRNDTLPVVTHVWRYYSGIEVRLHKAEFGSGKRLVEVITNANCLEELVAELKEAGYREGKREDQQEFAKKDGAVVQLLSSEHFAAFSYDFVSSVFEPYRMERLKAREAEQADRRKWGQLNTQLSESLSQKEYPIAYRALEQLCNASAENSYCSAAKEAWNRETKLDAQKSVLMLVQKNRFTDALAELLVWRQYEKYTFWINELQNSIENAQLQHKKLELTAAVKMSKAKKDWAHVRSILDEFLLLRLTPVEIEWVRAEQQELNALAELLQRRKREVLNYQVEAPKEWAAFDEHVRSEIFNIIKSENRGSFQWAFGITTDTNGRVTTTDNAKHHSIPEALFAHLKLLPGIEKSGYSFRSAAVCTYDVTWDTERLQVLAKRGGMTFNRSTSWEPTMRTYINQQSWPYGRFVFDEKSIKVNGTLSATLVFKNHKVGPGGASAIIYSLVVPGVGLRRAQYGGPHPRRIKPLFWAGAAGAAEGYALYNYSQYRANPNATARFEEANLYHQISLGLAAVFVYDYLREQVVVLKIVARNRNKSRILRKNKAYWEK